MAPIRQVERSAAADESSNEALALRLTNLVLPAPGSRIGALRRITARYDNAIAPGYCEACYASLGTVGTVGFGWLALCGLGTLLGAAVGASQAACLHTRAQARRSRWRSAASAASARLLELFVTPDIRAWNRISVVIAFLSLLAAGLLLDSLVTGLNGRRWRQCTRRRAAGRSACVRCLRPDQRRVHPRLRGDRATVAQRQRVRRGDRGAASLVARACSSFRTCRSPRAIRRPRSVVRWRRTRPSTSRSAGYLHSSTLRWSYGAIKGRPADWAAQLAGQPLSLVTAAVAAAGFEGVWVDPAAFNPAKANQVHSALRSLLGVQPLVSPDRDLWFFDLRPYLARLERTHTPAQLTALREATLHPLSTACVAGGLKLVNPSTFPRPATLTVRLSDRVLSRALVLDPGSTIVTLSDLGAAPMTQVLYATLTGAADLPFAHPGQGPASTVIAGLTGPPCPR